MVYIILQAEDEDTNQKERAESATEMCADGGGVNFMLVAVGSVSDVKLKADDLKENLAKYSLLLSNKIIDIRER